MVICLMFWFSYFVHSKIVIPVIILIIISTDQYLIAKCFSGERPFACSLCEKAFIKKIDLQRHEQIHSGLKPHCCAICNKSFLRKKNLNFHVMLHTEERPHVCPSCNKGFIRAYYLRDHIKKHHT